MLIRTGNNRVILDPDKIEAIVLEDRLGEGNVLLPESSGLCFVALDSGKRVIITPQEAGELSIQWEKYLDNEDPDEDEDEDDEDEEEKITQATIPGGLRPISGGK